MDVCIASALWLLQIMLLCTSAYRAWWGHVFSLLLGTYLGMELLSHKITLTVRVCSAEWLRPSVFSPAPSEGASSHPHQTGFVVVLVCIPWVPKDVEHFSHVLIGLLWRDVYSNPLPIFFLIWLSLCCWVYEFSHILDTNSFLVMWFAKICSRSVGCLHFLCGGLWSTQVLCLDKVSFICFFSFVMLWCHI